MNVGELLTDGFGRIRERVHAVVDAMTPEQLAYRADAEANSIGWLVWHLTRVQDDHIADAAGTEQVWLADGWHERFGLPLDAHATGYAHTPDEVAAVRVESHELLTSYHDAVYQRTIDYVSGLSDADLDRIVDASWDPPVTLGVRLVSVLSDDLQHVGQAAFVRGLIDRQ
ncbi:MAG: mycothiol transferase [Nocardioidaceae bacterium]